MPLNSKTLGDKKNAMEFIGDPGLHLQDDLLSNLFRVRIFANELMELYNLFNSRVDEVNKRESKVFEDIGWPQPVMLMRNFGGRVTDVQLNLYFKSFVFISRQSVEKILRSVYLARETLEHKSAAHKICDGSSPERFMKFIINVLEDKYSYDADVISMLKKHALTFIGLRMLRNNLKTLGTFNVVLLNKKPIIVIRLLEKDKQDTAYKYLSQWPHAKIEEDKILKIDAVEVMKSIGKAIEETGLCVEGRLNITDESFDKL